MKKFVAVAGNIGVGKSTLVKGLSKELGWEPFFEPVTENPYLSDFYQDMAAWSFHSQVFFLTHRLRAHHELAEHPTSVIQDRSVYEDAEIFAQNLYMQGHIHERDYQTYKELYDTVIGFLPAPDLLIYLRASVPTLQKRIAQRGRGYERSISAEYLKSLNLLYENWIEGFTLCPVLTVPTDNMNFAKNPGQLRLIITKMEEKLTGKDELVFTPDEVASAATA
ncbi:MAG: deoxynucleoside kinase [Anaerolineae bacterium]|nr:deoxynucleoside kinase [Anaerolineae bacterium]MDK1117768.1 deoxynucleoside kinase [Anaerolineae bacterium]